MGINKHSPNDKSGKGKELADEVDEDDTRWGTRSTHKGIGKSWRERSSDENDEEKELSDEEQNPGKGGRRRR